MENKEKVVVVVDEACESAGIRRAVEKPVQEAFPGTLTLLRFDYH